MNRMTRPSESLISLRTAFRRSSNSPRNLAPGDERAEVERDDALVLEALGHVAAHDALGEPFDDGRLADARLADEDRVVLGPARQDLDDAADLLVAADDRIELAGARLGRSGRGRTSRGRRTCPPGSARSRAGRRARSGAPAGWPPCRRRGARAAPGPRHRPRPRRGAGARSRRSRRPAGGPRPRPARRRALARGSSVSEPPWMRARLARIAASSPRNAGQVDAEPAERLGGDAVIGLDERGQQVLGVEDGALEPLGESPGRRRRPPGPSG